jgi:Na+/H+ antiporter NhaA
MAKTLRWTQIRAFIGAIFAIAVLFLFVSIAADLFGWNVPVLSDIANAIGIGKG